MDTLDLIKLPYTLGYPLFLRGTAQRRRHLRDRHVLPTGLQLRVAVLRGANSRVLWYDVLSQKYVLADDGAMLASTLRWIQRANFALRYF